MPSGIKPDGILGFAQWRPGIPSGAYADTTRLVVAGRSGKELRVLGEAADYYNPELSPDGKRLAVMIRHLHTGKRDIWVFDLVRGTRSRLTFDLHRSRKPDLVPGR